MTLKYYELIMQIISNQKILDNLNYEELINILNLIQDKKENASIEHEAFSIQNIINKLNKDEINFEQYFEQYLKSYHKFNLIFNNIDNREKLMYQVIDYLDKNKNSLKIEKLCALFNTDLRELVQTIKIYLNNSGIIDKKTNNKINSYIKVYKMPYKRIEIKSKFIDDNIKYEINDDIIDQALSYIEDKEIYKCYYTVYSIARKIVLNQLDYAIKTTEKKEQAKKDILKAILNKDIKQYLENNNIKTNTNFKRSCL